MRVKTSRIAAIIGHDKNESGYYSPILKMSEYQYYSELATYLNCADIFKRPLAEGYNTKMNLLADELNPLNYDLVIELHFNSYDDLANDKGVGCECIIYPGNNISKEFSEDLLKDLSTKYDIPNRGVKERLSGRGSGFLTKIQAPTIIYEPFFGDELEAKKFADIREHGKFLNNKLLQFLEK